MYDGGGDRELRLVDIYTYRKLRFLMQAESPHANNHYGTEWPTQNWNMNADQEGKIKHDHDSLVPES